MAANTNLYDTSSDHGELTLSGRKFISSSWSIFFKLLAPTFFTGISLFLALSIYLYPSGAGVNAYIVLTWCVIGGVLSVCWGHRLKRISVDSNNLYVSNWHNEIVIPLSKIESVESLYGQWRIGITLKDTSALGRQIIFLAKWNQSLSSPAQSTVKELRSILASYHENIDLPGQKKGGDDGEAL